MSWPDVSKEKGKGIEDGNKRGILKGRGESVSAHLDGARQSRPE